MEVLNGRKWICSYSGGKDSTTLVTWIEWLRRIGMVDCAQPKLVLSDTAVEYPFLHDISRTMMRLLADVGWHCEVVSPPVHQKLYCRIFGIGVTPVHPGNRMKMRWCTRATKIDPMRGFAKTIGDDVLQLSGVRWGESNNRDSLLSRGGCAAGGECGLPDAGEGVYGAIITWKTCKVIEWLSGEVEPEIQTQLADLYPTMKQLVDVYEVKIKSEASFWEMPPKVTAMRFGCIGCPAITREKITNSKQGKRHPEWQHLRRIYAIWDKLYSYENRCIRFKPNGAAPLGPIRLEARKKYFAELLDIQEKSGVKLVTEQDIAFIYKCWVEKRYPRGWSEADEAVKPLKVGLFSESE